MRRKVSWLQPDTYKNDYQFFRQWITDEWRKCGGRVMPGLDIPMKLRLFLGKLNPLAYLIPDQLKRKEALIVCCGAHPNYTAWPFMFTHELIPIVWDCWPKYHATLLQAIQHDRVKTIFCTSRQTRDMVKQKYPHVHTFWLPEGINVEAYTHGGPLVKRSIDILELGRLYKPFHLAVVAYSQQKAIRHYYSEPGQLLFKNFEELTAGLADAKLTVCYPRCMTHTEMAGNIETLTQRYWECMLSGTLIVGHAPQELIDVCGYNPVVEIGDDIASQVQDILVNISQYQPLCDRNRDFAVKHCSWSKRVAYIRETLENLGYDCKE